MSDIQHDTLPSGAPLVVERIDGVKSAAVCWLVAGGTAREPENRQGAGAMVEELLLRGAGSLGSREQADAFDAIGAGRAAGVETFHMRFSSSFLGERFRDAAPLIVDSVRRARFDEGAFEPTRDLCLQALEGLDDVPQERVMIEARRRHAPSPINRSHYGTKEGLAALSRDEVVAFWDETARPKGSVIAVAGDVDPREVRALLTDLLSDWEGEAPKPAWSGTGPRGVSHIEDATEQTHVAVVHDAPAEPDGDSVLERLAVAVLSGGMSGRLFTEVREKRGLCYAVSASYGTSREYGRVVSYAGTTPDRAQETLDVLVGELRRINTAAGKVTESELERARIGMKSRLVLSGESTAARAGALAQDVARLDRPRSLDEIEARIDAVTLEDLNAYLARRELGELTICALGPKALRAPAES